jgi:serine/threonine protein kinase
MVHGDIKPENVLIFEDSAGDYVPKVTDFGYSTVNIDDGLINLPISTPWVHPEQHRNGYSFPSATKMDVYSFGMLCFWIFLHDVDDYPAFEQLQDEKRTEDMPRVAAHLARSTTMYGRQENMFLEELFGMTLEHNHEQRSNFSEILDFLKATLDGRRTSRKTRNFTIMHANFQVEFETFFLYISLTYNRSHLRYMDYCLPIIESEKGYSKPSPNVSNAAMQQIILKMRSKRHFNSHFAITLALVCEGMLPNH